MTSKQLRKEIEKHGITITDVKVIGFCSKCRKQDDEILRNKYGVPYEDKDISCISCALKDKNMAKNKKEIEFKTLSEKNHKSRSGKLDWLYTEDVKKHLQEFKEELKEEMDNYGQFSFVIGNKDGKDIMNEIIDTQMQKHFGDKLIQ